MGFEALCPPGSGINKYAAIAWVLMELLPHLLAWMDTQVALLINRVKIDSDNGYDLLWCVLALSVPGFDLSIQIKINHWQDEDIFDFDLSFLLFFCLQAKNRVVQDDHVHSMTFLNAIADPAYADAITTLLTCITISMMAFYLNLCMIGLATQLHTNARTCAKSVIPSMQCTIGMGIKWDRPVTI